MRKVADHLAETLAAAGVKCIWGAVGDSLNGLTDAVRRQPLNGQGGDERAGR